MTRDEIKKHQREARLLTRAEQKRFKVTGENSDGTKVVRTYRISPDGPVLEGEARAGIIDRLFR